MRTVAPGPFLVVALIILSISSCIVDEADLSKYMASTIDNVEEARDIDVIYTDSSYKLFNLKAPVLRRVYNKYAVNEDFPEGIDVTFFDRSGRARSFLTAETARRDQATRKIIVQKNVVLRNDSGDRMDGPELIWDEKTKEISTDRFVKITRADGTVIYSYGFKSNESFTRYELNAVSGDMVLEDNEKSEEGNPTKTSRAGAEQKKEEAKKKIPLKGIRDKPQTPKKETK
jgi:LPS export ABC transporter protein LptC